MKDTERRAYIAEKIDKFYERMQGIMANPNATKQEDGIALLQEVNRILEEFDKLESINGVAHFKVQFELVKHRLQQALMTTKQEG